MFRQTLSVFVNVLIAHASYADATVHTVSIQGEHSFLATKQLVRAHNVSLPSPFRTRNPKLAFQLMMHVDVLSTALHTASTPREAALAIATFGKSARRISDKMNSEDIRDAIAGVMEAAQKDDRERTWDAIRKVHLRIAPIFLYQETYPGFRVTRRTSLVYELAARRYELGGDLGGKAHALGLAAAVARPFDPARAFALFEETANTYETILRTTQPVLFGYLLRGSRPRTRRLEDWAAVKSLWNEVIRNRSEAARLKP